MVICIVFRSPHEHSANFHSQRTVILYYVSFPCLAMPICMVMCLEAGLWPKSTLGVLVAASRRAHGRVATIAVNSFTFKQPVFVGDLLSVYADIIKTGTHLYYRIGRGLCRTQAAF